MMCAYTESTFSETNLMQWMPSREENASTGLECKGSLRVAFEVGLAQDTLKPDKSPEANCCCLFWKKSMNMKDKEILVL